ncbi:hypothetical protein conserved [Entamoeba histolytica]|uniref:C3H1-type domain-containing protein n=3 Tax=Entamoeba histolytica TaxID=5759 RepID=C4M9N9_ENTH1|nr:hypothetical protein, conserved [Entamoeba histolytica HM-1:IMSS]EAL48924.1 hypothetical protein, conserved [Entamoeba histolytica HM-1:IMSS]GAT98404.1 hypothetical protein conserved [Entamoeba histolytica]|eukprot:XP_654312.1 hypothetical protein, conserved [Entamoeba histolytica HM-1:IMSS]
MSQRRKQHKHNEIDRFKLLQNKTIIQRNLVYVTNIAYNIVEGLTLQEISERLSRFEFFGQYGEIIKIIPNIKTLHNLQSTTGPSFSAYITFKTAESSIQCIRSTNGGWLAGKVLNSSLGTTKYCSHFLRGKQCINPDCTYLHQLVSEKDYITKEELSAGKNRIDDNISQHISIDSEGNNYLPPIFTIEPIEIDLDTFQTDNPVLIKMVNRFKRIFVRDSNPHLPVHSSLSPLRAFRYDQSDSTVIKSPNYIFFLYNTRTTIDPEVQIPKEWTDCNKITKKVNTHHEEIKNDMNESNEEIEESTEESGNQTKEDTCKEETTTTLDDTSDSEQVIIKDEYSESGSPFYGEADKPFICKDYLHTFEILNAYKGDVESLISYSKRNELIRDNRSSFDLTNFQYIKLLIDKIITSDELEAQEEKEQLEEKEAEEEIETPPIQEDADEWVTVGKGVSWKKIKQNKKPKANEIFIVEEDNEVEESDEEPENKETKEKEVKEENKKGKEISGNTEEEKKENKKVLSKREIEKKKMKEMEERRREMELERQKKEEEELRKLEEEQMKEGEESDNESSEKTKTKENDETNKRNESERSHSSSKKKNNSKGKKKGSKKKGGSKKQNVSPSINEPKKSDVLEPSSKPPSRPIPNNKRRVIIDPLEQLENNVKDLHKLYLMLVEKANIQLQVLNERKIEVQPIVCQYPDSYFMVDH